PGAAAPRGVALLGGVGGAQRVEEGGGERIVERVAFLGSVHRQDLDRPSVVDQELRNRIHRIASGRSLASRAAVASNSATSRCTSSAAGTSSSISPAHWPTSTLPHSTSPSKAAIFSVRLLKIAASSSSERPARSAASNSSVKRFFMTRIGSFPRPTSVVSAIPALTAAALYACEDSIPASAESACRAARLRRP